MSCTAVWTNVRNKSGMCYSPTDYRRCLPLGQTFASSGCGRCLFQDEDHSGSRPHSFLALRYMRSWRLRSGSEWSWTSGYMRRSSRRANVPSMRSAVVLNSCDNFLVTPTSISSETWVTQSSCDLGTFKFCAKLLLGCSRQISLFNAANFLLFLRVAISTGKVFLSDK